VQPLIGRLKSLLTPERAALIFTAITGVILAFEVQLSPHGIRPVVDENAYIKWGLRIAQGHLFLDQPFFIDPLIAYVAGFLFWLTGGSLLAARLFFVAIGVGTVALIGATARTLFAPRTGVIAMWLLALYGPHTFSLGFVLKEGLAVHLTAWALFLATRLQSDEAKPRTWAGLGLVAGALMLCRGNFVPLMPFLALWALFRAVRGPGDARRRLAGLLAFCLSIAFPLSLATAHNVVAGNSWAPIRAQGGPNFWIGNNPQASGTYDFWPFAAWHPEEEVKGFKAEAERRVGHPLTAKESSNFWMSEGLRFWREQPGAAIALLAKKAWLVVHDYEIPDNYAFTCFRTYFTPVLWLLPLSFGMLLGLALVGGVLAVRQDRRARFPFAWAVLYAASVAAFYVFDRYRIPLCIVLCLFAAHALALLYERVRLRQFKGLILPALVVALAAAVSFIPTPISREREARDAVCVGQAGLQLWSDGLTEEAEVWLKEARARHPDPRWIDEKMEQHRARKAAEKGESLRQLGEPAP
jgi:4-amino-4-deoxy-L-arabinose transferase-like glycosyltransferase